MGKERTYWLAWSQVPGIGAVSLKRLKQHFGTLATAWQATAAELLAVEGIGLLTAEATIAARDRLDPDEFLEHHSQENPDFWTPADPDYPPLLWELPDPPPVLYYRGQMPPESWQPTPMVAIVGTRSPSEYGRRWTRRLSICLTRHGFTLVSGLAEGIDTEAHRSCLEFGGRTIAVLGCGTDRIYPWSNRGLYQQILASGLLLSEHPAGTKPDRMFFPRRNRIIAGLCRATLVMEAGERSGGLITARYANEYGRDVYVLPGSLDNPKAIGCLRLINKGANVIVDEDDLLELLGSIPPFQAPTSIPADSPQVPTSTVPLQPEWEQILQILPQQSAEAMALDQIVQTTQLSTGTVSSALLQLEMEGLVTSLPGMRYRRV